MRRQGRRRTPLDPSTVSESHIAAHNATSDTPDADPHSLPLLPRKGHIEVPSGHRERSAPISERTLTKMKARIKWTEGMAFVAETGSGHAVVVDGAPEHGGRGLGVRPMELVLAGAAACTAFDVVLILKKARQPVADCVVEAEADRAAVEPKVFTRVRLAYTVAGRGLDPRQVERAVKLSKEKYCSATIMLGKTAEIETSIRILEGDRVPLDGEAPATQGPD